jgi:hypothetical protein
VVTGDARRQQESRHPVARAMPALAKRHAAPGMRRKMNSLHQTT